MNLKTKLAAGIIMLASISAANATTYNLEAEILEPMTMMGGTVGNTIFSGSFDWDNGTSSFSNFSGMMNSSMDSMVQDISLMYSLATSITATTVTATVFKENTTDTFWGGGFNTGETRRYGGLSGPLEETGGSNPQDDVAAGTWDGNVANENAYFTFSFERSNMMVNIADMVYGDCTADGLMQDEVCMTGRTMGSNGIPGAGTMMATPLSASISEVSAVPVPAAAWLFGGALVSLFGANRRKNVLPA